MLAFLCFCFLLRRAVHLVNDVVDRERDREHPIKRNRPIASGRLSVSMALLATLCVVVVGALAAAISPLAGRWRASPLLITGLLYLGLNVGYRSSPKIGDPICCSSPLASWCARRRCVAIR